MTDREKLYNLYNWLVDTANKYSNFYEVEKEQMQWCMDHDEIYDVVVSSRKMSEYQMALQIIEQCLRQFHSMEKDEEKNDE